MTNTGPSEQRVKSGLARRFPGIGQLAGFLGAVALLSALVSLQAEGNNAQSAIENLENCSAEERERSSCIKILKRDSATGGKERIKAQLRGGRIIWYEFDKKSGNVRRVN